MWTYAEDVQNEEIMNPLGKQLFPGACSFVRLNFTLKFFIGTVVSNPNVDHATALTLSFTRYDNKSVFFPKLDVICETAANLREESSEDSGVSSLASLNGLRFLFIVEFSIY